MFLPNESSTKPILTSSVTSNSDSLSNSSSSATITNQKIPKLDKRLWRTIDFLHLIIMLFSLYTSIIVAILRNELYEQCPLYAKLYLRDNVTHFSSDTIDRQTTWGSVYTCEFASFAYLSAFVLSFISLWIHIVFRRVLRTERLLRLPIGLLIFLFTLIVICATIIVTDGVVKFCSNSEAQICSSSGAAIFRSSRWKIISLPIGGWLTAVSILLNTVVRVIQLFSKPKKSPETLKLLLGQLMIQRQQHKIEKDGSEHGSQISQRSREKTRSQTSTHRHPTQHINNREFTPELYPYYYPSIPQYRQIEKRSRFQRFCCPCFRRRRRPHSFHVPYQPYVIPEEYFHRLNHLKQNGIVPANVCHHHLMQQPVEQQTQTESNSQPKSIDQTSDTSFPGRRRSSVRFEDETPLIKPSQQSSTPAKSESIPVVKEQPVQIIVPVVETELERNVSFKNNEDDLWTTVTIQTKQSMPIQSSHFNRLLVENLSRVNTSIANSDNGITAIHVNSTSTESHPSETIENGIPLPPPLPPQTSTNAARTRGKLPLSAAPHVCSKPLRTRHKPPPPPSSRTHTTSSEDDNDLRHIKPVEEIDTLVANKYNYNDVSQALKSNVERLKSTFLHAQDNSSHYDTPKNIRTTLLQKSFGKSSDRHSSDD